MLCQRILKIKCPRLAKNAFAIQHLLHHSIAYIFIHYNCTINYYKMNAFIISFPRAYLQGRANRFLIGGVYSKIWAPFHSRAPLKKNFPENLSQNNIFPEIFSQQILHFFKFCNSTMSGPPPRKLGPPILLFFGGCYTPHTHPRWHGPADTYKYR